MRQNSYMKNHFKLLLLFVCTFLYNSILVSQEKGFFLKNRFNNNEEIITKKTSKEDLSRIKYNLELQGVFFSYNKLKHNSKKEIIQIFIKLKNKKSNFSSLWKENNNPIPNIRLGEFNGIVYALSSFNKLNIN